MGFFEKLGAWFVKFFNNLGNYFIGTADEEPTEIVFSGFEKIIIVILIILVAYFVIKLIGFILKKAFRISKKGPQMDVSAKSFIISAIKALLWVCVAFITVSILGIDLGSFAGILSAITVALGLALQDLISSFASGIIIINNKNFVTGDYISVKNGYGQVEGTVNKIKLFVTILKTPDGQTVVLNNNDVVKANLVNFSTEEYRRINFTVSVAYDSDVELVKSTLKEVLAAEPTIEQKDKAIDIHINNLGDYGIDFAIKAFTNKNDYWPTYNNLREKILIAFRDKGIEIPYPVLSVVRQNKED